nr:lysophospholipid acyltransferase LPEAT2-like [Tanacetum cinerariifolium]
MNRDVQKFNSLVQETLVMSEDKHKWKNPESTLARRNRLRVTDEEPEGFGEDALPQPPGAQRIAESQRSSNSTASFGSNSAMFKEMMQQQYELDRKANMEVKGSLDADEDIGVDEKKESVEEVVVSGGEALGVDEDESNRVISVLKDGGGEFDDRLDDINLDSSQDFMIRVLKSIDVSGGSLVGFLSGCIARRIMKCLVLRVDGRAATAKGGRAMQVIYVNRFSHQSRKHAVNEIKRKASSDRFPRLLLFPEGTTTNGRLLISFQHGAFIPGYPIQPVVVRYPHVHFDQSWSWFSPSLYPMVAENANRSGISHTVRMSAN